MLITCMRPAGAVEAASDAAANDRTAIAIEALSRLQNVDLNTNPKLKEAVLKLLQATRGTPNFVKLVKQFNIPEQQDGLLEVAVAHPKEEAGVDAARLLLQERNSALLQTTLAGTNVTAAVALTEALGNTGEAQTLPLLAPLLADTTKDASLRKQTVRSLARTEKGAETMLEMARQDKLPTDLKFTAAVALAATRWAPIKEQAAQLLPLPQGQDNRPLPPLSQLLQAKGDPAKGANVFTRETSQCATCHRVRGQGGEVGPDLSEIGSKLGKDALFEAILDPSAGISFGYEAFELELKSGDEAFGIITGETPEEISMKDTRGIVTRYQKSEVIARRKMTLSIMPAGLQLTMSNAELVDLVAYLTTLQK